MEQKKGHTTYNNNNYNNNVNNQNNVMSSHWDASTGRSRSHSPMPPSARASSEKEKAPYFPFPDEPDFELVDSIEWGPENANPLDELAARPKPDRSDDPCGCSRPTEPGAMTCNDLSCVLYACQEECRSNCTAGEFCDNKRIQRKQWKQLEVFSAGKKGKGLKVMEDVKKGDFVVEYVGRAVNKGFLPTLFRRYASERKLYIMALDSNIYLDARRKGGIARYINHSCEPNCVVERWKVRGILRAAVIASKDMPAGTELSFDYQWERKRGRAPTKCHCFAPKCRGTLEVPRSMEEAALERKLSTHWSKPLIKRPRKEIVNRCIRVFSKETQEYFVADVTSYDDKTGKHLIMYRHDLEEVWEDLKEEDWMILDEEAEQFIIRKKTPAGTEARSLLDSTTQSKTSSSNLASSATPNLLLQGRVSKNYIYVQTPICEALKAKHLIDRCERSCQVSISTQQFARPPLPADPDDPDDVDKYQALDQSLDGTVWKLTIVGLDIPKAHNILEKNVVYLEKQLSIGMNGMNGEGHGVDGATGAALNGTRETPTEAVLPRSIVESVKRRLPALRDKCRTVNFTFAPSESKSKQFAKIIIEGNLKSEIEIAQEYLWRQLLSSCEEMNVPKAPSGVYADLGFLGGELSSSDFRRLLDESKSRSPSSSQQRHTAKEDLASWSPFFASFETTQRCTIWVQADADKGRIDAFNRVVSEATPNSPRKVYFGCEPKLIPNLWSLVKQRTNDLIRGVKYLHLGADRLYQPMMMRNSGQFFEFVRHVTGASVTVDSMTGDHLRIDGKESPSTVSTIADIPASLSEVERAALAEELIRLQVELFRDHTIRQQSWMFGRDWTLARRSTMQGTLLSEDKVGSPVRPVSVASRAFPLDAKSVNNACLEMADIVSNLSMDGNVAAHASIIMYRFTTVLSQPGAQPSDLKMREVELASIFLANKAQKVVKWKKLDSVLESAYKSFYPGVDFDASKEEILVWEDKVIAAESEILETLSHDIFWRGFDWMLIAAKDAAKFDPKLAREAFKFATSGPVLAAGADLWLTYGAEYIFAATAGFFDLQLEKLFPALSLMPFKVQQAAEIIFSAMKNTSFSRVQSSHPLFKEGKKGLARRLPRIKETCASGMSSFVPGYRLDQLSEIEQRYQLLGRQNKRRRTFRGVDNSIIKECIFPALDGIGAESNCSILLETDGVGKQQVILEGSWRSLAIASSLLSEAVQGRCVLVPDNTNATTAPPNSNQAKGLPGVLRMTKIETSDGWAETIQSKLSGQAFWGRKTGGKTCVPAKIRESELRQGGLRWWIPPRYGPSQTGSICDLFLMNDASSGNVEALASLTHLFQGESAAFSMLKTMLSQEKSKNVYVDRFVAVSLQRWPIDKVAKREQQQEEKKSKSKKTKRAWKTGFSAGALQEMSMLFKVHGLIKSSQGHPNFLLPIGVGIPEEVETAEPMDLTSDGSKTLDLKKLDEDIFSLTRTSLENEVAAERERKRKDMVTGPHLVFHPTPFVLQRFTVRKKRKDSVEDEKAVSSPIFSAWVHDMLSALVHCHANDIVLRNFLSDQIMVDHSGVVKFGSFYRATVLSKEDKKVDILQAARERKKEIRKHKRDEDDDVLSNPYAPPEMLLGSPKFTKETDIWIMGCLLCHLLLGKTAYSGKDRQTMLLGAYKLVGTPVTDNFKQGVKFPYYEKPPKRYVPGVVKGLSRMMKGDDTTEHAGAIDLISKMLHLDPSKRITAKGALQHEYMQSYIENSASSEVYQKSFVHDWIALKKKLMKTSRSEEDEMKERERGIKRKAMLLAASKTGGDDDLYDMNEFLGDGGKSSKMPKV